MSGADAARGRYTTPVQQPSALEYQTFETVPGQQQAVVHRGVPVGHVQKYTDPGHGPLWSAVLADHVHARRPSGRQVQRGFVDPIDAAAHVMDAHRDVAQIEGSGVWRPGPPGAGPNLPGH
jgi:hypothetical protein